MGTNKFGIVFLHKYGVWDAVSTDKLNYLMSEKGLEQKINLCIFFSSNNFVWNMNFSSVLRLQSLYSSYEILYSGKALFFQDSIAKPVQYDCTFFHDFRFIRLANVSV